MSEERVVKMDGIEESAGQKTLESAETVEKGKRRKGEVKSMSEKATGTMKR